MIVADREGVIHVWNRAAERIFGHTAQAALGQTLDLIVPERFREAHWTGYDRALAARAT
ncbi:MAG: PAS domain S-box protein, partial [Dehalococcoidia bacterium]|nr:PAS domain S-box protein [Dehalococcoidia bacterium]